MDRSKSVLVEGKGEALRTMAAYIDLNPVRAGLCKAMGKAMDGWRSAGN